jgi:hypothetical protein
MEESVRFALPIFFTNYLSLYKSKARKTLHNRLILSVIIIISRHQNTIEAEELEEMAQVERRSCLTAFYFAD